MCNYITFPAVIRWREYKKMRELMFTNCGLTSATNLTNSYRKFKRSNDQTPITKNESEQQNFEKNIKLLPEQRKPSFSFEISPAKTEEDFQLLVNSAAEAVNCGLATFASVTWHLPFPVTRTDGPPPDWSSVPAIRTARILSEAVGQRGVLLHLSAAGLRESDVADVLATACQEGGVRALFLVRGDGENSGGDFRHAVDLVKSVRSWSAGGQLCIGVAGYPLGHPESASREEDLCHLRDKVKAGADFIISQVIFDAATFVRFVEDCRRLGITVPILAGVPIVTTGAVLVRLCRLCRVPLPETLLSELRQGGGGVRWCVRTCQQLLAAGVDGVHFFTLNSTDNLKDVLSQMPMDGHGDAADAGTSGSDKLLPLVSKSKGFLKTV